MLFLYLLGSVLACAYLSRRTSCLYKEDDSAVSCQLTELSSLLTILRSRSLYFPPLDYYFFSSGCDHAIDRLGLKVAVIFGV